MAALLLGASAAQAQQPGHAVRFSRPDRAGDLFDVSIRTETRHYRAGPDQDPEIEAVQVDARAEILAVSDKGDDLKIRYTIQRLTRTGVQRQDEELLPRRAVVVAEWKEGKTLFTVNGAPPAPAAADALEEVASLPDPAAANADELYGTSQLQKPGGSWPIHVDRFVADWKRRRFEIDPHAVHGTARLDGIDRVNGVESLVVSVEVSVDAAQYLPPPTWNRRAGATVKPGPLRSTLTAMLPVDVTSGQLCASGSLTQVLRFDRGDNHLVESRTERIWDMKIVPVKRK